MKLRIKFRKYGPVRFIGHLDVMRFFQKATAEQNWMWHTPAASAASDHVLRRTLRRGTDQ